LAAEAGNNFIPDGRGYDGFTPGFPQKVPHQRPGKKHPDGGNQLFVDGSIRWVKLEKMYFLTSWNPGTRRLFACPGGLGKCHPITTQRHETHGAGFPAQTRLFEQLPASYPAK
jgi:prepilin-type processing-associated H-X9-DG protein